MSGCCEKSKAAAATSVETAAQEESKSCCASKCASKCAGDSAEPAATVTVSCCGDDSASGEPRVDWMLWGCLGLVAFFYLMHLAELEFPLAPLTVVGHSVHELINTMWFSVLLAALFVGLLGRIPQDFVTAILGRGGSLKGILRATMAGVLMDLCSHGILMVGMKLHQKGASLGQVMAFLIASPWNSLSLTLILIALIGLPWTLAFIVLSMGIAIITGLLFDRLVANGQLPGNGDHQGLPEGFHFWREAKRELSGFRITSSWLKEVFWEGLKGSQMVVRWLLFGVLLASAIRGFVSLEDFQTYFGPTMIGLLATLLAATVIEVCSEGSTPIAADLMTRAKAPGNSFAFLMTGVATDYTEVMVIKDTMKSWKIALFLPLLTVPQVVVIALILNGITF